MTGRLRGTGAVVAYGGAGISSGATTLSPVEQELLRAVARPDGRPPVVCLLPTAGGDDAELVERARSVFADGGAELHAIQLFRRTPAPFSDVLDRTDLVYVTGGAVANLLALWRLHGLDTDVLALQRRGVPVAGSSAGALVWARGGVTTSFGAPAPWHDGLGLLPGSLCPHLDTQPERAQLWREAVTGGQLPPGWGLDEHAAGVFRDGRLVEVLRDDGVSGVHEVGGV